MDRKQTGSRDLLEGSGGNNPDMIMMVWFRALAVFEKSLIWEMTRCGGYHPLWMMAKVLDSGRNYSMEETPRVHLHILDMPRLEGQDHTLLRPFLRIVLAATKLQEWGNASLWNKESMLTVDDTTEDSSNFVFLRCNINSLHT